MTKDELHEKRKAKMSVKDNRGLTFQVPKRMDVEGRRLATIDRFYFANRVAPLNCIAAFDTKGFRDDPKVKAAFRQVVKTSPLLQTYVKGDEEPYFSKLPSEEQWPVISIKEVPTVDSVMSTAREIRDKEGGNLMKKENDGQNPQRFSAKMWLVRGPKRIALVLVCPHHFADGTGMSAILLKFYLYALSPKAFWFLIDRQSPKDVPLYQQMALKKDLPRLKGVNLSKVAEESRQNASELFVFEGYDRYAEDASSKLHGMLEPFAPVPEEALKTCRDNLRKQGISVTTAFQALAMKTMAVILDRLKLNPDNKNLAGMYGVDAQKNGSWGHTRLDRTKHMFPVVGNFTMFLRPTVAQQELLDTKLEGTARICKDLVDKFRNDVDYRIAVLANAEHLKPSPYILGVSSVVVPDGGKGGRRKAQLETFLSMGSIPCCWFYVVSWAKTTSLMAHINLPLPAEDLDPSLLKQDILRAAKGSALEPLLTTEDTCTAGGAAVFEKRRLSFEMVEV